MPLVALSGGIASGKSTIAARLAELGAIVIDADEVVRRVQAPGSPVLAQIAEAFGDEIIRADGSLDRPRLAEIVFADGTALTRLNGIVHPAVRAYSQERFRAALAEDPDRVVVYDVPLLAETSRTDDWDLVVIAHAPEDIRLRRLQDLRGMSAEEAVSRVGAQASDAERLALADVVIDTAGTLDHTLAQVDALWRRIGQERSAS